MMQKIGLEADPGLQNMLLLQGFATPSLQFKILPTVIIELSAVVASIIFSDRKKSCASARTEG
jgi:hypothetical protein